MLAELIKSFLPRPNKYHDPKYWIALFKAKVGGKYLKRWQVTNPRTGKKSWKYKYKPLSQRGAHEITLGKFKKVTKIADETHKAAVEKALQDGHSISMHILKDYPDLITKYNKGAKVAKFDQLKNKVKDAMSKRVKPEPVKEAVKLGNTVSDNFIQLTKEDYEKKVNETNIGEPVKSVMDTGRVKLKGDRYGDLFLSHDNGFYKVSHFKSGAMMSVPTRSFEQAKKIMQQIKLSGVSLDFNTIDEFNKMEDDDKQTLMDSVYYNPDTDPNKPVPRIKSVKLASEPVKETQPYNQAEFDNIVNQTMNTWENASDSKRKEYLNKLKSKIDSGELTGVNKHAAEKVYNDIKDTKSGYDAMSLKEVYSGLISKLNSKLKNMRFENYDNPENNKLERQIRVYELSMRDSDSLSDESKQYFKDKLKSEYEQLSNPVSEPVKETPKTEPAKPAFSLEAEQLPKDQRERNMTQELFKKKPTDRIINQNFKPKAELKQTTPQGLTSEVKDILLKEGMDSKAREFTDRAMRAKNTSEIMQIASEYVTVPKEPSKPKSSNPEPAAKHGFNPSKESATEHLANSSQKEAREFVKQPENREMIELESEITRLKDKANYFRGNKKGNTNADKKRFKEISELENRLNILKEQSKPKSSNPELDKARSELNPKQKWISLKAILDKAQKSGTVPNGLEAEVKQAGKDYVSHVMGGDWTDKSPKKSFE